MSALNAAARAALRAVGITQKQYAAARFLDGRWHGDSCGCTDDRCIGFHHDAGDECHCLPVVIAEYLADRATECEAADCLRCHPLPGPAVPLSVALTDHLVAAGVGVSADVSTAEIRDVLGRVRACFDDPPVPRAGVIAAKDDLVRRIDALAAGP